MARPRGTQWAAFTLRLPVDVMERLDAMALKVGLSRTQLIEKMVKVGMDTAELMEADDSARPALFDSMSKDLGDVVARAVEAGIRDAMRRGGIDLAVHRMEEIRREVKKNRKG